jgi:Plant transposon protein
MIYEVWKLKEKIASRFFLFCQHVTVLNLKKRYKKLKSIERRRKRSPTSTQERSFNFWGKLLINLSAIECGPLITSREEKLFRRRFRVPCDVFCDLVKKSTDSELFGKNARMKYDFCGRSICPIAIKVLGILRTLGRNWCCDDVAEASGIGESIVRHNFHTFISNFVERYYDVYIHRPSGQKLAKMMKVYVKMGLPGCIRSTDCVHVKWHRCPCSRIRNFPLSGLFSTPFTRASHPS